jgi:cytidylate kinase
VTIPVITIDGPSGTGKGTISLRLAKQLGWHFLDSGALYRLVAYGAEQNRLDFNDIPAIADYARTLPVRFDAQDLSSEPKIYLDDQEVTEAIRSEAAGNAASKVAAMSAVREALLQRQRDFRQEPGLVADGRDMGTTVFRDALLKIYLTASPKIRARRRHKQLKEKGIDVSLSALVKDITERDERDANRSVSPLKPADDAVMVDTSSLSIEEVMALVKTLVEQVMTTRV